MGVVGRRHHVRVQEAPALYDAVGSERKINRTMEFLVKEMNMAPRSIAGCPVVLFFSLDKRIIPRCSVVKMLASKGMVKEDWSLTSLLVPVEKVFLEKLVIKYEEELPELMEDTPPNSELLFFFSSHIIC